jgi:hypothetical protein
VAKHGKHPVERLITALFVGGGFGVFYYLHQDKWWLLACAFFFGVAPLAASVRELAERRLARRESLEPRAARLSAKEKAVAQEREVLRIARDSGGVVTPSLVAVESQLSVEEAERTLDELAKKGHAELRVASSGRVEYEFVEFLPNSTDPYRG